jgi:uncharacterized protein (TIGR02001 family)
MKKTLLAVTLAALTSGAATTAMAADPKAPAPDFEISGNFALVSDYRFRGISQTNRDPALQGGFDLAHKSGFYAGTWASNVSQWANPGGSMEVDFYIGYGTELPMGVGIDVGHTWYQYPGNRPPANPANGVSNDTREFHIGFSYNVLSYKYSRTSTTWFGVPDSKGSDYHAIGLEFSPLDKLTLSAAAGSQKVKGTAQGENSFKDYSVGGSYDLGNDYSLGLTYHKVSFKDSAAKTVWFEPTDGLNTQAQIFKSGVVLSLSKSF